MSTSTLTYLDFFLLMNRSRIYVYDINKTFGNFTEKNVRIRSNESEMQSVHY